MTDYTKRIKELAQSTHRTRTIHYFPETDLRNGHMGLATLSKRRGFEVEKLAGGDFLIFSNRKQTQVKLLGPGGVLVHLSTMGNGKIEMEAVRMLPKLFNGTEFNMEKAEHIGLKKAA